jgi:NAD-dependent DNA ligase
MLKSVVVETSNIANLNAIVQVVRVRLPDWISVAKTGEFIPIQAWH